MYVFMCLHLQNIHTNVTYFRKLRSSQDVWDPVALIQDQSVTKSNTIVLSLLITFITLLLLTNIWLSLNLSCYPFD